jgi:carbon-monoxide dehydrogenase small subunit
MELRERTLRVNGRDHVVRVEDRKLLLDTIREELRLTGAHAGCEHGVCGACTVIVDGRPVRSCLILTPQAEGLEIETIESLEAPDGTLDPVQEAFVENLGFQCGYCAPGMILTARAFLADNPHPTADEAREAIASNLCRCTGYDGIVTSILAAAEKLDGAAAATNGGPR